MHKQLDGVHSQYSQDPLLSCALEGVANVFAGIKDVSIVIHSPQGCAATVGVSYDQHEVDFTQRKIGCTRLFEKDIVLGASSKLEEVIEQADKSFNTKIMFVVGTCAADIIGEDIESICRNIQPKIGAQLIPVYAGGFRGNSYAGMNIGLNALIPYIDKTVIKIKNCVNIIAPQANSNPTWFADLQWVKDILEELDIFVKTVFSHDTTFEEIKDAGQAGANILLSHEVGYEFAKKMEALHGIPLILEDIPMPIGIGNTNRWLREIGRVFNKEKEVEKIIDREEKATIDVLRKRALMMIPRYRNALVTISCDMTLGIGMLGMMFEELEMIPETIIFKHTSQQGKSLLEKELERMKIHPEIIWNADGYALRNAIANSKADVIIGSSWEKYLAEEFGFRIFFDVFEPTNRVTYVNEAYFGYRGMLNLLQIFANDWEMALRSKHITKSLII